MFGNGHGDAGDGEDGEQRHLKAGVEEAGRVGGEQAEGGESDGVEGAAVAPQEAAGEVEGDHPEGALHGLAEAGEDGIGERGGYGEHGGRKAREANSLGEPEDDAGEDGEMEAGDDEEMEGAGAFEADAGAALEPGAVAGNHGGEHRGVFGGEAEEFGEPAGRCVGVGELHDLFAGGLLEGFQAAGQGRFYGRGDDGCCSRFGAGQCADPLIEKVGGGVPNSRVDEAFGGMDGGGDLEGFAALEFREGGFGGSVEGEAESSSDGG